MKTGSVAWTIAKDIQFLKTYPVFSIVKDQHIGHASQGVFHGRI